MSISLTGLDGSTKNIDDGVIDALRQSLRGTMILPGDDGYDQARTIWNGAHDTCPGLIIRCSGTADVIDTVTFARDNELLISIRGGGHNVAGTSLCHGGVMLDLSSLREVRVDPQARTADVGPGATLGDLDRETQAFGLVAPAGVVSSTGVAGLTLGGGMGWVRRKHGLSIDNLLSVDIVTADGTFRRASETENSDLFWALRGGGGNFGVVTNFRFQLHPLGPIVPFAAPIYPIAQAREVIRGWRDFCEDAVDEISSFCLIQTVPSHPPFPEEAWGSVVVALPSLYAGDVEEGLRILQPLRELGTPAIDMTGPMPFRVLQGAFDGLFPTGNRYYWKTATLATLDDDAIDLIIELGHARTSPGAVVGIWQMGGAMARVPEEATGYGSRNDPWTVAIDYGWTDPAEDETHIAAARAAWERVNALSGGGMYLHYGSLEKEDQIRDAYGKNYERLAAIKRTYDPKNLFRVNQNIVPAEMEEA